MDLTIKVLESHTSGWHRRLKAARDKVTKKAKSLLRRKIYAEKICDR